MDLDTYLSKELAVNWATRKFEHTPAYRDYAHASARRAYLQHPKPQRRLGYAYGHRIMYNRYWRT